MDIIPLNDRVLLKRKEAKTITDGGIILPDQSRLPPYEGELKAVGPGKKTDEGKLMVPEVKAGDTVLFGRYGFTEIKVEGEPHLLLREEELLAVLKDNEIFPLGDRIVIQQSLHPDVIQSIIVPEQAKVPPTEGKVIAVGPGRKTSQGVRLPVGVKPGETVIFPDQAGTPVVILEKPYLLLREEELLAISEPTSETGAKKKKK